MKHYPDPVSTPLSEDLPSDEIDEFREKNAFNLAQVRPGLTAVPQMSLADFRVYSTPYGLEVHFCQRRIRENLVTVPPQIGSALLSTAGETAQPSHFFDNGRMLLLTLVSTVVFVGGAVVVTGSVVSGVIVAALLAIVLEWVAAARRPKSYGKAILRISRLSNGRTLLALKTMPPELVMLRSPNSHRPRIKKVAVKSTVHCANLPVSVIKTSSVRSLVSNARQINFIFERGNQLQGSHQLRIVGNRQEIRWLCQHISAKCYKID